MDIAISGCGITGTTVGFLLAEQGHDVTIFEQADDCQPIGAGILLQPSGQQVLQRLGLFEDIHERSERLEGLTAVKANGKSLVELRYDLLNGDYFGLGVHRGKLFELLLNRCRDSGVKITTSHRVTDFKLESPDRISLATTPISNSQSFDFVIAADGSRSAVRGAVPRLKTAIVEYDYAALWMTGQCEYQPGKLVQFVDGTKFLVGLLPIGNGHSSFFWGLPTDGYHALVESPIHEWKNQVLKLCPQADSMLNSIDDFSQLTFARYQHVIMQKHYCDRIVFLGDAAHATSPHLGQGVNLALEDAELFANLLSETGEFQATCKMLHRQRRAQIRYYQHVTRMLTPFFQADGSIKGMLRDTFLPWFPKTPFVCREMIRTLCGLKQGWLK